MNLINVSFKDLLLGISLFNLKRDQHLLEFALPGFFKAEKQILGQLLGNG